MSSSDNMNEVLIPLLQSPRLPDYVRELSQYLQKEESRRKDFYHSVRDDEKAEFINGEIICHSPARKKHIVAVEQLGNILSTFIRKTGAGIIMREKALVRLLRNDFEPDICFFRKESATEFSGDTMFYPAPDFVVEVLSESTEKRDRGVKFDDYAFNGVKEYWLVDPDKQVVEQYLLTENIFILKEKIAHGTVCCTVLNGLEIPVNAIFNEEDNDKFLRELIDKA